MLNNIDLWINQRNALSQPTPGFPQIDQGIGDIDPIDIQKALPHFSNDVVFFSTMLLEFKKQLIATNQSLIKAVESHNSKKLVQISHDVKGLALNFCAFRLAVYADELEKLGKEGNFSNANSLLDKFEGEVFRIRHFTFS
jgi:HPt (histidine-containing phosphotransfer) domain-containing protein